MNRHLLVALLLLLAPLPATATQDLPTWTASDDPVVRVGSDSGPGMWGSVAGVVRLPSGRIVAADAPSGEIRFFDGTGAHLSTAGRLGEGPGEFRTMRPLLTCGGDSVMVWDPSQARVAVFDGEGVFVRQFPDASLADGSAASGWKLTCNQQGTTAFTRRRMPAHPGAEGPIRLEMEVTVVRDGTAPATVGPFPGDEFYFMDNMLAPRPLGLTSHVAVGADHMYLGVPDEPTIRIFSLEGRSLGSFPVPHPRRPLTAGVRDTFVEGRAAAGSDADNTRRFYARIEFPDALPAFDGLLVDDSGNVWIRQYEETPGAPSRWSVHHADGAPLATAVLPPRFTLFQVDSDRLIGVERDDFDVESVVVYRLSR